MYICMYIYIYIYIYIYPSVRGTWRPPASSCDSTASIDSRETTICPADGWVFITGGVQWDGGAVDGGSSI